MMRPVSYKNVNITGGFWRNLQELNSRVTINAVYDRFNETGRFEAFKFNWKEGMPFQPHIFWDSDVAKWMEAVAYITAKNPSPDLEKKFDSLAELIEKNQADDGYFNIYYMVVEPGKRFTNRDCHELYCLGHLIEAAVAYFEATGKDKLLKCVCRYADLVEKVFKIEKSAAFYTPGHEEIELALVRLYHCTGEKRYLELSKYFIDTRGTINETPDDFWANDKNFQSHLPCREQHYAVGHSVRAGYLYSGMADIAREYSDEELKKACQDLFDDIYFHKMYITAGVGQSDAGESYTVNYDLQNDRAYTETCASIALVYFSHRMQQLGLDSRYGDVIERAIYNGIISGLSLDGKSFFYENPLEINLFERNRNVSVRNSGERFPITQRLEIFGCSCCPPNINRFIASAGNYICSADDEAYYVTQFISSEINDGETEIIIRSGFPYEGNVSISCNGLGGKKLAVRIPWYSRENFTVRLGEKLLKPKIRNGYAFIDSADSGTVNLTFDVSPKKVYANAQVMRDAGKCAIVAGPLVYCAERTDNEGSIFTYCIDDGFEYSFTDNTVLNTRDIIVSALRVKPSDELYSFNKEYEPCKLRLIPYFAFANRGETDMAVWLNSKQ